ncbi:MAG: AAA family ATPase [Planctomycetaceae bacterium]|nr:AAA family ATPase [Planctomycetaceae bacterium]
MQVSHIALRHFRRLEDIEFSLEPDSTMLVGPNNSGKTSAGAAFRLFFRRGEFTISDFNVGCIAKLDAFGNDDTLQEADLPAIEMDLWLSIDADKIEFGRAFALIPNVTEDHDKVGIRLRYSVKNADDLRSDYAATFPSGAANRKPLSHFLSIAKNLSKHFDLRYYALEGEPSTSTETAMEPEEGRRVLSGLIRIDFIDAQRNIHDQDSGRHNKLSAAFAAYYKHNLEKPTENEAATKVIDENNTRLTQHYDQHFKTLLGTIAKLGVPSAHDRKLQLVSSLNAQEALQGNTELYYVDAKLSHQLPEAYNGLGFKNLIYMAIQVSHFHTQWIETEKNRPLCQLVFIEEPEVHLHAQVQQVFIENIGAVLAETAKVVGETENSPQLIISTHSTHLVDTVKFEKVRYFRRCPIKLQEAVVGAAMIATKVLNLRNFRPKPEASVTLTAAEKNGLSSEAQAALLNTKKDKDQQATLNFLKKYLKLTHCDLFFADAAILVEGTVEKLLMSQMIDRSAPALKSRYITVLEVGGAYAHRFASLMGFLGIPYLVITDIDTVQPADERKACPADQADAKTSNAALKSYLGKALRSELVVLSADQQVVEGGACYVAFQRPVTVSFLGTDHEVHGRTLEETFVYENLDLFRTKAIEPGCVFAQEATIAELKTATYRQVKADDFKKTEFALAVASVDGWNTPKYISDGLGWLTNRLQPTAVAPIRSAEVVSPMPGNENTEAAE